MNWRLKLANSKASEPTHTGFVELTAPEHSSQDKPSEWLLELALAPGVQLRIAR